MTDIDWQRVAEDCVRAVKVAEAERDRLLQAVETACVNLDNHADQQERCTGIMLVALANAYRDATKTVRAAVAAAAADA